MSSSDDESRARARMVDEIESVFEDLETLLKNPDVIAALTEKNINTSLAMLAMDGLHAYLKGEKAKAVEDLTHFAEEVAARAKESAKGKPS